MNTHVYFYTTCRDPKCYFLQIGPTSCQVPSCQVPQSRQSKSDFCYVHSKTIPTNTQNTKYMNVLPSALMHAQASAQSKSCTPQESRLPGLAPQKLGPPNTGSSSAQTALSQNFKEAAASASEPLYSSAHASPPHANAKFEIGNAASLPCPEKFKKNLNV